MKEQKFSPNLMQQIPTAHTTMLLLRLLQIIFFFFVFFFRTQNYEFPFPKTSDKTINSNVIISTIAMVETNKSTHKVIVQCKCYLQQEPMSHAQVHRPVQMLPPARTNVTCTRSSSNAHAQDSPMQMLPPTRTNVTCTRS